MKWLFKPRFLLLPFIKFGQYRLELAPRGDDSMWCVLVVSLCVCAVPCNVQRLQILAVGLYVDFLYATQLLLVHLRHKHFSLFSLSLFFSLSFVVVFEHFRPGYRELYKFMVLLLLIL